MHRTLQWRHNGHDGVSNNQSYDCLLNRLFRWRLKKTSKLRVTGLSEGNSPVTGEFPAQRPVTRKMFPFDDVIIFGSQVLIYTDREDTELLWIPSSPFNIPDGAVLAGQKANGDPLYLAMVLTPSGKTWRPGNYDPQKNCAEYGTVMGYRCNSPWKIAVLYNSEYNVNSREATRNTM